MSKIINPDRCIRANVFKETEKILADGKYLLNNSIIDIKTLLSNAVNNTELYYEFTFENDLKIEPIIRVNNETTTSAALRMLTEGKDNIVALNFASGHSVGGDVVNGALAQEEDLCRSSGLFKCLQSKPDFYIKNSLDKVIYTDQIIYSPNVPFFRNDDMKLSELFNLSIITSPAPNLRNAEAIPSYSIIRNILLNRAIKILKIAAKHQHKNIILGAWGCGAFRNDGQMVAEIFKEALTIVPAFECVYFAVYDKTPGQHLYNIFKSSLDK